MVIKPFHIRILLALGIILFMSSLRASVSGYSDPDLYVAIRTVLFVLASIYFFWHFRVTKGHRAAYDRISEGTILLMIIYNPFKPFILDVYVWNFLDIVFLWVFILYFFEVNDIQKKMQGKLRNWGDASDDL